jgi:glycosyltransferase involved in cell wall biosynthesis
MATYFLISKKILKKNEKIDKNHEILIKNDFFASEEMREEIKKIKNLINIKKQDNDKVYKKSDNPKISVVIPLLYDYNVKDKFYQNSLFSIQNQDLKDIEIIIVKDKAAFSSENSDNDEHIIKELMAKDERITLIKNEENKGALYTKTKGILNSKGKYVMILENGDIYTQKDAFAILYEESEKNSLDILGFSAIIDENYIHQFTETPTFHQPNIGQAMYTYIKDTGVTRVGDVIFNYFFKTELFINIIKQIDEKYLNQKMNYHEDFLLFFLLTRNAYSLKHIKKVFYMCSKNSKINNKLQYDNLACLNYLNYADFLYSKTKEKVEDKEIASYELENWYLNTSCRYNEFTRDKAINITQSFSENNNIHSIVKKNIFLFMFQNITK